VAVTSRSEPTQRSELAQRRESALWRVPLLWSLLYVVLFAIVLFKISWSLGDTYSHLAGPALSSWRDAFVDAFTARGREYRPLFTLGIKAAYEAVGTWLPFYQALVLLSVAGIAINAALGGLERLLLRRRARRGNARQAA